MQKLIATKSFTYNTRRLQAGDEFEARPQDALLLVGIRKARDPEERKPGKIAPPHAALKEKITPAPEDDIAAVRAEYLDVVGKKPFMGWDIETLREKIAAARS